MDNKVLAFIKKYKIALVLSLGIVLLMKFTEKDYKEEYELANNKIVEVEGNISKIEKENNSEELNKEINDLKDKSGKLSEEVTEKETKYDNLEAEKEEKLEKEKREAEEEEKKRIEAQKKLAEERKEQTTNNITTAKPNNTSNNSTSGSQNKSQASQNKKPSTNKKPSSSSSGQPSGSIVYANGGSSKSNKYHKTPTAHKMEGAIKMTESQAKNQGYEACKICY